MSSSSCCWRSKHHQVTDKMPNWTSSPQHIHPSHRDRRKHKALKLLIPLFEMAAQPLALLLAALSAEIIQSYTPVPRLVSPSFKQDCAESKYVLELSTQLKSTRRWVGGSSGREMRHLLRNEVLERTVVRAFSYLSRLISDPSPSLFFGACLCFAGAISFVRTSHPTHRYQDRILLGGILAGIIVAAVQSAEFLMDVKGYLAWSIVLASAGSVFSHRVLGLWPGPEDSRAETPNEFQYLDVKTDEC